MAFDVPGYDDPGDPIPYLEMVRTEGMDAVRVEEPGHAWFTDEAMPDDPPGTAGVIACPDRVSECGCRDIDAYCLRDEIATSFARCLSCIVDGDFLANPNRVIPIDEVTP